MSYTISSSNMSIQQKLEQKFGKAGAEKVLAELKQPEHAEELAVLEKLSPDKLDQFLSSQAANTGNTGNAGGTNFVDNFLGYLDSVANQWFGYPNQYQYTGYTGSSQTPQSRGSGVPQPPPPPPPPPPPLPRQQPQPSSGRGGNPNGNGGTRNGDLFGGISQEFTTYGMPNGYSDITSDVSGQKFF